MSAIPSLSPRYIKYLKWHNKKYFDRTDNKEIMEAVVSFIKCQYKSNEIENFLRSNPKFVEYFI